MYEQDRFIVRLRQKINGDPAIIAAWLGGSHGRNQPDPFSDLDVTLLFANADARQRAWLGRVDFCQNILAYVAAKSHDHPHYPDRHVVLYANGTLADIGFLNAETLQPRPDDRDIKILKDTPDKRADDQQFNSASLGAGRVRVRSADLKTLDDTFWIQFWDVYRVVRRGDSKKPFIGYVHLLAETLPKLMTWLLPNSPERQQLVNLQYTLDANATRAHLQSLLTTYRAARSAIIRQQQLDFRIDGAFEREIERNLKR